MSTKRVLHLVEHLYLGGIERLLEQLALNSKGQAELYFFTYETAVLAGIGKSIQDLGFPVYCYKKTSGRDWTLVRRLMEFIQENDIEVVHTHDFGPMEYAVLMKMRFPKLRLVHTQHTMHHFVINAKYRWFFQAASYFYDHIIGVSEFVSNSILINCPLMNRKALRVIANGVNTSVFTPSPAIIEDQNKLKLVSVARISNEKNLDYLFNTCKLLKEAGIPFSFHHAGTSKLPETQAKLQKFVVKNHLENEIVMHGFVENAKEVLDQGDVFVSSSLREGHPVALLEAMSSEKVCICSDIAPHRETSHGAVELYDVQEPKALFERLKYIYENKPDLSRQRHLAREVVLKNYSIEKMVGSYVGLY